MTKILCEFLTRPLRSTWPAHLILLHSITLIFSEELSLILPPVCVRSRYLPQFMIFPESESVI